MGSNKKRETTEFAPNCAELHHNAQKTVIKPLRNWMRHWKKSEAMLVVA